MGSGKNMVLLKKDFRSGLCRFFTGVMISRISGLGRDLAMAYAFGDHPMVAAFIVAFRLVNVFRRFFGEGPLQAAFIPQFEGLRNNNPAQAYQFFRNLAVLVGMLTALIIVLGEVLIGLTLHQWSCENQDILLLIKWLLPSLFFISLYGLNLSFLHCHHHFFISSMAPLLCNTMWIIGALTLKHLPIKEGMIGVAQCILIGYIIQYLVTTRQVLHHMDLKQWLAKNLFSKEVKVLIKGIGLGAVGVGAVQINGLIDALFARSVSLRSPVYLWYSNRFQQLALSLFGMATIHTLVPILSRAIKGGNLHEGRRIFSFGCRQIIVVMVPMTVAIYLLGFSAIHLVFGRGLFTPHATWQTAQCLTVYSVGLVPATLVIYQIATLYAQGNFKTPALFAVLTVGINTTLNGFFVIGWHLGAISIALATSLGNWLNFIFLHRTLNKKGWQIGYRWKEYALLSGGVLIASGSTYMVQCYVSNELYNFILAGIAFVVSFALYLLLFKQHFFNDSTPQTHRFLVKDH